jgi:two-component SAPR family response regulator
MVFLTGRGGGSGGDRIVKKMEQLFVGKMDAVIINIEISTTTAMEFVNNVMSVMLGN